MATPASFVPDDGTPKSFIADAAPEAAAPDTLASRAARGDSIQPQDRRPAFLKPSDALIQPDVADHHTTVVARVLAEAATRPPATPVPGMEYRGGVPPGPAPVPQLATPWETDLQTNSPPAEGDIPQQILNATTEGAGRLASGVEAMTRPTMREKAGGLHEAVSGAFGIATPAMLVAGGAAPLRTALSVGTAVAAQKGVETGLEKLGLPKEYAAVVGDLTGLVAGAAVHKYGPAVKERITSTLRGRWEAQYPTPKSFQEEKANAEDTPQKQPEASESAPGVATPGVESGHQPAIGEPGAPAVSPALPEVSHVSSVDGGNQRAEPVAPVERGGSVRGVEPGVPEGNGQQPVRGLPGPGAGELPGNQPQPDVAGSARANPGRRVTGSANIPLNDAGREQSRELAGRVAGKFNQVLSSPKDRSLETARMVDANAQPADWLGPWRLGEHEGKPADAERAAINRRVVEKPDEAPGVSAHSGEAGESFNQFRERVLGGAMEQVSQATPDTRVLDVTHGRNLRLIDAWAKAGMPEDKSIDTAEMTKDGEWSKPGQVFRLTTAGLEAVEKPERPGIYFARHGETEFQGGPGARGQGPEEGAAGAAPETGPHGPIYQQFHRDAQGAVDHLLKAKDGEAVGALWHPQVPGEDIDLVYGIPGETPGKGYGLAKIEKWHHDVLNDLQGHLLGMSAVAEKSNENTIQLENGPYHAVVRRNWKGDPKTWLLTEYRAPSGEQPPPGRTIDIPGTPEARRDDTAPPPSGGSSVPLSPGRSIDVSGNPVAGAGETTPSPSSGAPDLTMGRGGAEVNRTPGTPATGPAERSFAPAIADLKPEPEHGSSSVILGSGLGALDPLFREAKAEGDALRLKRNAALEAAKKAIGTPEQKKAGEALRAWVTSERDLWGARANQAIDIVTRKVLPKTQDREAVAIAREFRHNPQGLQAFIDGSHPYLQEANGGVSNAVGRLDKLMPAMRNALRMLGTGMTDREQAADSVFTNLAQATLDEGKKHGFLGSRWQADEYVPHLLNPKGEGEVARMPSTAGHAMGNIGKFFGFGERRADKYPTLVHAVADGVIPKTLDPSAAFTIHGAEFARARATHLLEGDLAESGMGFWGAGHDAPDGWVPMAPHTDEFQKLVPFMRPGGSQGAAQAVAAARLTGETVPAAENVPDVPAVATQRLYVPPFIAKALAPMTDPDYLAKIPGFAKLRAGQRVLKQAILGMSGFHLLTENVMAKVDIGISGIHKALTTSREDATTLANERDLIGAGGTTSIQGGTMDAYRGLRPGTIPTRGEVIRAYIPGAKPTIEIADAITRATFDNVQRRYKIWGFALHRDAWMNDNPGATPSQVAAAKQGIASYTNGVFGGLHWENMGISRAVVEVGRAMFLAPDWSGSNVALAKYAFDAPVSWREFTRHPLRGALTKDATQARLARAFFAKQLVQGLVENQALSLLLAGALSKRPFQVYQGKDKDGNEIYQNVVFRGAAGDLISLATKMEDHGLLVGAGVFAGSKAAPLTKLGMHALTGRDDFGREIAPKSLGLPANTVRAAEAFVGDVSPIPIAARNVARNTMGDQSDQYVWSERVLSLIGSPAQHVAPEGEHKTAEGLKPNNPEARESSFWRQVTTGKGTRPSTREEILEDLRAHKITVAEAHRALGAAARAAEHEATGWTSGNPATREKVMEALKEHKITVAEARRLLAKLAK